MHAIRLESVDKHYGEHHATKQVSLEIQAGHFAVVLGPSGCGKTTLLRLVAGLERADSGTVWLHGRDVTHLGPGDRALGMVFQSYALFPHLSVQENLLFGLRLRRVARAERARRLEETATLLGLEQLLRRKPSQLSGGQQQRVALGRAIIGGRRTVLMDEPLSNLDAKLRQEMRREMKRLAASLGMTVLYVTHDQAEALGMGDVVVVMNQGRIEQIAAPERLYEHPESLFVARFIGTPPMNLLPAVREAGGRIGVDPARRAEVAGPVLGIRPEQIEAAPAAPGLEATVDATEYLGADAVITCRYGEHTIAARVRGHRAPRPGDRLYLRWRREDLHLFDGTTGRRLPEPAGGASTPGAEAPTDTAHAAGHAAPARAAP